MTPTNNNNRRSGPFDTSQQIFLTGRVMFEDGSPINHDVAIQRICGGSARTEGHPDSKGRFSVTLGQPNNNFQDASSSYDVSNSSLNSNSNPLGGIGGSGNGSPSGTGGTSQRALAGCELRASYPGYRSDAVILSDRRNMDNGDIGTIVLHRLTAVQGTTISLTTALAPKDASKAYEKGMDAISKDNVDVAERQFRKAVGIYPKYAIAWFELGRIEQRTNRIDEARQSYQEAISADPKYVSPFARLAALDAQQEKWPEAVEASNKGLALNPVEFPELWYYNAIALYRSGKPDEALKSANECLKLDTQHKLPSALLILASVNTDRSDWAAAARNLHDYLQAAPNAGNADIIRKQLAEIEQNLATAKQ
jgi:tetratricopeptide (TPR) repeat protein